MSSSIVSKVNAVQRKFRDQGLTGAARSIQRRVYSRTDSVFLERPASLPFRAYRLPEGCEIRRFDRGDIAATERYFAPHARTYNRLLSEGLLGYAAFSRGDLVGIAWFATDDYYDGDVYRFRFPVRPHEVYQFAGLMAVPYRRTALSALVAKKAASDFAAQGRSVFYAITDLNNNISLRWHFGLGFEERGTKLVTRKIFGTAYSHAENYNSAMLSHLRRSPHLTDGAA